MACVVIRCIFVHPSPYTLKWLLLCLVHRIPFLNYVVTDGFFFRTALDSLVFRLSSFSCARQSRVRVRTYLISRYELNSHNSLHPMLLRNYWTEPNDKSRISPHCMFSKPWLHVVYFSAFAPCESRINSRLGSTRSSGADALIQNLASFGV